MEVDEILAIVGIVMKVINRIFGVGKRDQRCF